MSLKGNGETPTSSRFSRRMPFSFRYRMYNHDMIVCLGWGSLIWNLGGLPVEKLRTRRDIPSWACCAKKLGGEVGNWRPGGPKVKVEFVRQSKGNRLTLVLHAAAEPVCSFWARMTVTTPDEAVRALARREGTSTCKIGKWPKCSGQPNIENLRSWSSSRNIDCVVWTALGSKFRDHDGDWPTEDEAVAHLGSLCGCERVHAEQYVRCAPRRIKTPYRSRIERCLKWTPCE